MYICNNFRTFCIGLSSTCLCFKRTLLLPPECVRGNNAKGNTGGKEEEQITRQPYRHFWQFIDYWQFIYMTTNFWGPKNANI